MYLLWIIWLILFFGCLSSCNVYVNSILYVWLCVRGVFLFQRGPISYFSSLLRCRFVLLFPHVILPSSWKFTHKNSDSNESNGVTTTTTAATTSLHNSWILTINDKELKGKKKSNNERDCCFSFQMDFRQSILFLFRFVNRFYYWRLMRWPPAIKTLLFYLFSFGDSMRVLLSHEILPFQMKWCVCVLHHEQFFSST